MTPSVKLLLSLSFCILPDLTSGGVNFRFSSTTMTVTEGEPVSMECRYSRKTDDRYLLWGYVPRGTSAIKQLLYWNPGSDTPTYISGKPGRYRAEKNFRRKVMKLQIAKATQQDSSRYFCQLTDNLSNGNTTDFCSCGTTLKVQAVPPSSAPLVELHSPFAGQLRENGTATLLCLASGFYPSNVRISWQMDGRTVTARVSQQPMCQDEREKYTAVSRLQLSSSTWMEAHRYQCTVTHPTLSRPIVKELRTLASLSLRRPTIRMIPPSIQNMVTHRTATLGCVATQFIPDPITFSWMAQGVKIRGTSQTLVPTANEDGSYSARSLLTVALADWKSGISYTCQVPNAQSDPKNRTLRVEDAWLWKQPSLRMTVIGTEEEDEEEEEHVADGGTTTLACFVSAFYPGDIYVSWREHDTELSNGVTTFPVRPDPDGTFHTVSQLSVPSRAWHSGHNFTCLVGHQSLNGLKEAQLRKDSASLSLQRPTVRVIPPSIWEMVTHRTATLGCVATQFIPDNITFSWMAQGLEIPGTSQTLVPTANEDGSYSARSQLTVALGDWKSGTSYTCQVPNAQSDPKNRTLRVEDAQLWKQPSLQMTVIEAEDEKEERHVADEGTTTLACFVSAFYPGDIYVSWREQDTELSNGVTTFPVRPDPDGTFHTVSQLFVPSRAWHSGHNFTCLVGHLSLNGLKEAQLRKDSGWMDILRKAPWLWGSIAVSLFILCIAAATLVGVHCGRTVSQSRKGSYQIPKNNLWALDSVPLKEICPSEVDKE